MPTAWVLPKPAINSLLQTGAYEASIYTKMRVFVCSKLWLSNSYAIYCVALPAVALFKKSSSELPTFEVPENVNNTSFCVSFCI